MGKSKVGHLDSTVHAPRTIVHLTVNEPPVLVVAPVVPAAPSEEALAVLSEIRQANPRNQPVRYEVLQRWADVLERHLVSSPPL